MASLRRGMSSRNHEHILVDLCCIDKLRIVRPFAEIRFSDFGPLCPWGALR